MSTAIKVTFNAITDAAGDVRSTAANVQAQLDSLRAGVAQVARSWEGVAREKYQARQAELKLKEAEAAASAVRGKLFTFGLTAADVESVDPVAEGAEASLLEIKAPFTGTVVEKHAVQSERVDAQVVLEPGDMLDVPKGLVHYAEVVSEEPCTFFDSSR